MSYFVNIGSDGTNGRNKSGVGSRGYQIIRKGCTVTCRWGGVTVDHRQTFRWAGGVREKVTTLADEQLAREALRYLEAERIAGGYSKLPMGARIHPNDASARTAPLQKREVVARKERPAASKTDSMRAISIRQPFVELILNGKKTREFRSQLTRIRGRVYLYASAKPYPDATEWRRAKREPGSLPTGVIVGSVEIVDCEEHGDGFAYRLARPKRLRKHLTPLNQPQPRFWVPKFSDAD